MMAPNPKLQISFRGTKIEQPLCPGTTVGSVKEHIVQHANTDNASVQMATTDVRLVVRGKILEDNAQDLYDSLVTHATKKPKTVYLMATGISLKESAKVESDLQEGLESAPRVRDDLTDQGKTEMERRKRLGRQMMVKAARGAGGRDHTTAANDYGFGGIETLPNLPRRDEAQRILETLANDPGIRACMAKHKWKVGSLAELYPEGKVGESEVCVMGLNQNKGRRILLRIRTDDLKGFRKMLSIRKVLFHELAHNVHSEHDGKFFQLMRQIEAECSEMDWTQGAGLDGLDEGDPGASFEGGTYRLGGIESENDHHTLATDRILPRRELAAQAALRRMTAEEEEIQNNCGCGRKDLFLPPTNDDSMEH